MQAIGRAFLYCTALQMAGLAVMVEAASVTQPNGFIPPISFEQNVGQSDPKVRFLSRGPGYTLFLTGQEAVLALSRGGEADLTSHEVLRMTLRGALSGIEPEGERRISGKSHYLTGSQPGGWRTNVPHFGKVSYHEVYQGIDLVYHGDTSSGLEYDFVVQSGADPERIRLVFSGMLGASLDEHGNFVLKLKAGEVIQHAPVAYQEVNGVRQPVAAGFLLHEDGSVGFHIAKYDLNQPLVIDPVISYSTYLGGSSSNAKDIKVIGDGGAYIYGYTMSADFPLAGNPYQGSVKGGMDAYIGKLTPDGSSFEFMTYLGGSGDESNGGSIGPGLALDGIGNIYVTGRTASVDFPLVGPLQSTLVGGTDYFVSKLSRDGSSLLYSTYLGGPDSTRGLPSEAGPTIAVDMAGNAHIMGYTNTAGYPTVAAYQSIWAGGLDVVLTKIDSRGQSILFSTYLGGTSDDKARGVTLDRGGNIYITGRADSRDFPMLYPLQPESHGLGDVFLTKFTSAGQLAFSTYIGGSNTEKGRAIALDGQGNVYLTGNTQSTNFPVVRPTQANLAGSGDMFLVKISADLTRILYATYLGGASEDLGGAIAVDSAYNVYMTGYSQSSDFPVKDAFQPALSGVQDAIVVKISSKGIISYASYLGGNGTDEGIALSLDPAGNVVIIGNTNSSDFPLLNPLQSTLGGVFVTKIK